MNRFRNYLQEVLEGMAQQKKWKISTTLFIYEKVHDAEHPKLVRTFDIDYDRRSDALAYYLYIVGVLRGSHYAELLDEEFLDALDDEEIDELLEEYDNNDVEELEEVDK
jgi:hypothetical protein